MPELEVYQLCCLGYSGSSILNILLDAFEGFRGLGEIERVFRRSPIRPCILCCPMACTVYDRVRLDHFYSDCASVYPGVRALVDSSKRPPFYEARRRDEPSLLFRTVLLFKTPHEYLYSWTGHVAKRKEPRQAWKMWADFHTAETGKADVIVRYRDLARDPQHALERIVGRKPRFRRQAWWNTDTHIIGGNTAVISQKNEATREASNMFAAPVQSTSGRKNKYQHRKHAVFLDEQWRYDGPFKARMDRYYRVQAADIEPALANLGLSIEWLQEDLWSAPCARLSSPEQSVETDC